MSKQKIAVSLDESLVAFLDRIAQGNRSEYLNKLLAQHQRQVLQAELIAALKEDSEDLDYQREIQLWDSVIGDGIDAVG